MKYIASVIKSKLPFGDKSWESKIGGKRVVYTSKCLASVRGFEKTLVGCFQHLILIFGYFGNCYKKERMNKD